MGKQSKRKRRAAGLIPPEFTRALEALALDPAHAHAIREAATALESAELWQVLSRTALGQRGTILMAFQAVVEDVASGKPCDFCEATARRIRFFHTSGPEAGESLVGFARLCDPCARKRPDELKRLMRGKASELDIDLRAEPYYRRAILGRRIGDASGLPPRASVQDCSQCGQAIWYDQDARDWGQDKEQQVTYVCVQCAERLEAAGRLHDVPKCLVS